MSARRTSTRYPDDLEDAEVRWLRRLGFSAAIEVLRRYATPPIPAEPRLEFVERFVRESGVLAEGEVRFATAQAAEFLTDERSILNYVPDLGVLDSEWLSFMVRDRKASDSDLAFLIQRSVYGAPLDHTAVREARETLGLPENRGDEDEDTLAIIRRAEGGEIVASCFLADPEWLRVRVLERNGGKGMSDGEIAAELARIGYPCDRSTVRLHRKNRRLSRAEFRGGEP